MKDNDPWEMGSIAGDFNNYPSLVPGESFQAVVQEENQSRMQWSLKVEQMELGVGEMKLRERSKLREFAEQRTREEKTSQKEEPPKCPEVLLEVFIWELTSTCIWGNYTRSCKEPPVRSSLSATNSADAHQPNWKTSQFMGYWVEHADGSHFSSSAKLALD